MSDWYVPRHGRPQPVSNADSTYLGAYGLRNPWAVWLLNRYADSLSRTPQRLAVDERPPRCPAVEGGQRCGEPMRSRPGAWRCYLHEPPASIAAEVPVASAPDIDVLAHLADRLDCVLVDGRWKVLPP
jgi:hypothetical protein